MVKGDYNVGYMVDESGNMPPHIKRKYYRVRDLVTGNEKEYRLPSILPGVYVWYISRKNSVKEVYSPPGRDGNGLRIFNRLGAKTEIIKPGTPIEDLVKKLKPKYEPKAELVPKTA